MLAEFLNVLVMSKENKDQTKNTKFRKIILFNRNETSISSSMFLLF